MKKAEIKCINKDERESPTKRITNVGGTTSNSVRWKQSVEMTIQDIERNEWEYFVLKNGQEVKVIVAKSKFGNKYIKTEADDYEPNNLLSLPECP